ncbi:MAG: fibronectin type III domain-containing protein, partial [Saprospiraceae bacterium]|nr:fibronectin type III domain-containing protein [Saprospiraceae bacterium]
MFTRLRFRLSRLWIIPFFTLVNQVLPAQAPEKCPLPPPDKIWVTEVTPTTITVQWSPVPNAQMYAVDIFDEASGDPVANATTPETEITIGGLIPGRWYRIALRASACEKGPFGPPRGLVRQTSIIIVDVIIQRECPLPGRQ